MEIKCKRLGNLNGHTGGSFAYMVYDSDGLCPTINCMGGGGREPMIIEEIESERYKTKNDWECKKDRIS